MQNCKGGGGALQRSLEEEQGLAKAAAEKNKSLETECSSLRGELSQVREQVMAMEFQLGQRNGGEELDGRDETISMLKDSVAKMHHLLRTLQIEPPDLGAAAPGPSSPSSGRKAQGGEGSVELAEIEQEERAVAAAATAAVSNITSKAAAKRKARSRVRR